MFVQRNQPIVNSVMVQQSRRNTRILRDHGIDALQYIECPQTDVTQVTNWGGDYI